MSKLRFGVLSAVVLLSASFGGAQDSALKVGSLFRFQPIEPAFAAVIRLDTIAVFCPEEVPKRAEQ